MLLLTGIGLYLLAFSWQPERTCLPSQCIEKNTEWTHLDACTFKHSLSFNFYCASHLMSSIGGLRVVQAAQ